MSEALTPKLTREQYRIGYLNNMGKEISNEAYNLAAVASYLTDGESVGDAINQSATLTQGIPLATLKAVNAVKFRQLVENSSAAVQPLNMKEQQFIYTYSDAINQMIRSGYRTSDRGGGRISAQLFRQIVSDMMRGAMNHVPQYRNVTVPDAVETGDQTTNATSQFVDAETQMSQMGVPESVQSTRASSRFTDPLGYDASSSSGGPFPLSRSSSSSSSSGSFFSPRGTIQEALERGVMSAQDTRSVPVSRSITTRDSDRMSAGPVGSDRSFTLPDWARASQFPTRVMEMGTPYAEEDEDIDPYEVEALFGPTHGAYLGRNERIQPVDPTRATLESNDDFLDRVRRSNRARKEPTRYDPKKGKGMKKGCGPKCCGAGLGKPLVPFGNYLIDLDDLNNSHLSLYTAKGNKQRKVPRKVIGGNVSNVLKSLVVGQRPKPKDILSLNEDERDYLNGVGMAAKIEDLQELPTKKKTETQKDMHEFEILKGQIAAGNDNKELVQDFKRKLLKMIHAKKVSKSQGHDLLLELASMGI